MEPIEKITGFIQQPHASPSLKSNATVATKGELIGKNKEDYVRLKGTATDIVKILELLPSEKRYEYLVHASSLTSYSDPTTQKPNSTVPITNNLLQYLQSLNVEGSAILGDRISAIGIDVVPEAKEQPVYIDAKELANKLDELLHRLTTTSNPQVKLLQKARDALDLHFKSNHKTQGLDSISREQNAHDNEPMDWEEICKRIYVESEATSLFTNDIRLLLKEELNEFVKDFNDTNKRIAVIMGNPGAGKTTFAKQWLSSCFAEYKSDVAHKPIPLFITLHEILKKTHGDPSKLLERFLEKEVGLTPNQISVLKAEQPLIVFCDGYDEVSFEGNLYQENHWHDWPKAKFVITTRPEKFGSLLNESELKEALVKAFSPTKVLQNKEIPKGLMIKSLCEFNEANIKSFIEQWISHSKSQWQIDKYLKALQEIPGLSELTSNPIILSLVLYTLPDIVKEQQHSKEKHSIEQRKIERINIYDFFVKNWFYTQSDKVWRKLKELNSDLEKRLRKSLSELKKMDSNLKIDMTYFLRAYTKQLGYWCLQNSIDGKLRIEIPISETLKDNLLPAQCQEVILEDLSDEKTKQLQEKKERQETEDILTALRSGCLLKCDHEYFKFFHKSLVEYFAQEHIFRGVVGGLAFEKNCEQLNTQIAEPNLLRMLAERAQEDEAFARYLYQVVRESKKTADVALAASNAITILNYAKKPLNLESWQGIRIPHADLSGAILHCADFRKADLTSVNFRGCNLEEADMSESHITGCTWNLPTQINFESEVKAVIYPNTEIGLVVGEESGQIHFIDTQSWTIEKTIYHYNMYSSRLDALVALTIDGDKSKCKSKLLASASRGGNIYLWELPSGKYLDKLSHQNVSCIALNTSGKRLASGDDNQDIYLWDIIKKECIVRLQGHTDIVWSVIWSPDGKQLASGSKDKTVRLWDVVKFVPLATLQGHTDRVLSVTFSPDGKQLASGSNDRTVRLWDAIKFASLATLQGHTGIVWSITFSSNGKQLASGSNDGTVRLWDAIKFAPLATLQGHTSYVGSVIFSPDGKQLASGSDDKTVRLWDVVKFAPLATLQGHIFSVWSVAWSPDGKQLASGSADSTARLWDVVKFASLGTLQGHTDVVWSVAWSPDGKQLASGSDDKTVRLWDAIKFAPLATLQGHTNYVWSVAWSPDGKQLASGSADSTARLWDVVKFASLGTLQGHTDRVLSVTWSSDGKQLASGSADKTVRLWDVKFAPLATLQGHTGSVWSVAWSPDGTQLASGSGDNTMRLWNTIKFVLLATMHGHTDRVCSVTFSPDGKQLTSGSRDKTVRLWEVNSGNCIKTMLCGYSIQEIKFVDDRLLIGGIDKNIVHSIIYQKNDRQLYVLIASTIKNIPVVDKLNLEKTKGLTVKQHKFLINQGAVGKPSRFSYVNVTDKELDDEKGHLKQLQSIKQLLQSHRETSLQAKSLFDTKTTISFLSWSIYLYRVTKPTFGNNSGSNASNGNRHVYGLLEGLDQLGKRILIRFDLVEDNSNKSYARVKIKNKIIESLHEPEGQKGFYELSKIERVGQGDSTEIVCFRAGTLDLKELDNLLCKIIEEMQRQLQPNANRISYKFLGGDEGVGDAHNCLTWLRYLLKEYKNVKIPRGTFELFGADPKAILPESRGFGIFASGELPEGVRKIDISTWEHKLQENAHQSRKQNR